MLAMDRKEAEVRWQKAVARYQRKMNFAELREMVRRNEPPVPPYMPVDPEAVLWFKTLSAPPSLDGLDAFTVDLTTITQPEEEPWLTESFDTPGTGSPAFAQRTTRRR
jgi:hypothetical protein